MKNDPFYMKMIIFAYLYKKLDKTHHLCYNIP